MITYSEFIRNIMSCNGDIEEIGPDSTEKYRSVIFDMLGEKFDTLHEFDLFKRKAQRKYKFSVKNTDLLKVYREMVVDGTINKNGYYEQFMRTKKGRGEEGVIVCTLVTSPWPKTVEENYGTEVEGDVHKVDPFYKADLTLKLTKQHKTFSCKYDCFYCPNEPGQPKSYLKLEPAVARANQLRFDPVKQLRNRGETYYTNGHIFDKLEIIILGGTITSYPDDYVEDFIRDTYYAANTFNDPDFVNHPRPKKSLEEEIILNETSTCRIIGLTLETRPDQITPKELIRYRRFGVTRVQLGIQHTDDQILKWVNRGCKNEDAIRAVKMLKDNCFKVDGHFMPDLPGSDPEKDWKMFEYILDSPDLQLDQWKIYPCSVVPWTKIEKWHQNYLSGYDHVTNPDGLSKKDNRSYSPYAEQRLDRIIKVGKSEIYSSPLIELLIRVKAKIHPWIRINRVARDILSLYISGGNDREDLRQIIESEMHKQDLKCRCIRCREVRGKKTNIELAELTLREYDSSEGRELFLSYESPDQEILYGFLRLRLNEISGKSSLAFPELEGAALVRELHVYGNTVSKGVETHLNTAQHMGFGKKLLRAAEKISADRGYEKIAVISGVGVRNYYRKQGYTDSEGLGNFQIKSLGKSTNFLYVLFVFLMFYRLCFNIDF